MKSVQGLKPFLDVFQGIASEAYIHWHDVTKIFCLHLLFGQMNISRGERD